MSCLRIVVHMCRYMDMRMHVHFSLNTLFPVLPLTSRKMVYCWYYYTVEDEDHRNHYRISCRAVGTNCCDFSQLVVYMSKAVEVRLLSGRAADSCGNR